MKKIEQWIKAHWFPLSLMLTVLLGNAVYKLINEAMAGREVHNLMNPLDRNIPFLEIFVVPYIVWYPFIFLSLLYFCFFHRTVFYRSILAQNVGHYLCYLVYIFYQTTVPRPIIDPNENVFLSLVNWIYSNDEPINCLPSIHVITTYMMMRSYHTISIPKVYKRIIEVIAISIFLSTVFIKQHVVIDGVAAIVIGEIIFRATRNMEFSSFAVWRRKRVKAYTTDSTGM